MTPQEWIDKVAEYEDAAAQTRGIFLGQTVRFAREGAQHLAAALEEIARLKARLAHAERVVIPDDAFAMMMANGSDGSVVVVGESESGERFRGKFPTVPASRVLKDGEVAVGEAELAALREFADGWSEFRSQFDDIQYHHSGMGCGIEDRGIHDRYAACEHGWECAMERVAERFPEIDTLDALRAQGKEGAP